MTHKLSLSALTLCLILPLLTACSDSLPPDERPLPASWSAEQSVHARKLPFDGAHNFRDLGGYQTRDGRTLRWGVLYRSDKLAGLSAADEQYIERLEIRRVVDFRSEAERAEAPNRFAPDTSVSVFNKPIAIAATAIDDMRGFVTSPDTRTDDVRALMIAANREMIENHTPAYREFMQELLHGSSYPTVFHCTAGKDRTGLAAALVLSALNVPRETILEDYLATNTYTQEQMANWLRWIKVGSLFRANEEAARALLGVDADYINAAFEAIDETYGSMDNYLQTALGIGPKERQQLQEHLLY